LCRFIIRQVRARPEIRVTRAKVVASDR